MPSVHASAVLVGARAVLIRGPSGAGKSRLALALLRAASFSGTYPDRRTGDHFAGICAGGELPFAMLVADDRSHLEPRHGRLLVRPAPELAGLIEAHGLGIRRLPCEPVAVVGLVVDLAAADGARLPATVSQKATIDGIELARLAVAPGADPLPLVLAALSTQPQP
jgi:serine kinase of HPr protein (carbohydrate metabolism regulator)